MPLKRRLLILLLAAAGSDPMRFSPLAWGSASVLVKQATGKVGPLTAQDISEVYGPPPVHRGAQGKCSTGHRGKIFEHRESTGECALLPKT